MRIAPNIYLVPRIVANSYLIEEPAGLTLIDAALPGNAKKIARFILSLGHPITDLKQIIITHADIDHYGSLEPLRRASGAAVAASAVEADAMVVGKSSRVIIPTSLREKLMRVMMQFFKAPPVRVDDVLTDGMEMPLLGGLQVLATPGHTPGHISLWAPQPMILFSGDSIMLPPNQLIPSQGTLNWDQSQSNASFRLQAGLQPAAVLGGHGWTDQDVMQKFARGLETATSLV
jgi:glyoxylase-like metal-dependent hydrolase (beta-lactamase superfamily II)